MDIFNSDKLGWGRSKAVRLCIVSALLITARIGSWAQQATVLSAEQVAAALKAIPATPPTNVQVITAWHYGIKVAYLDHRIGPGELHESEDRVFYLVDGAGSICLGGSLTAPRTVGPYELLGDALKDCRSFPLATGAVVSIPRNTPYQLRAPSSRISFVVVRIKGQ